MNLAELNERIDRLPVAMQRHYRVRLDELAKRAHDPKAEAAFLRRLEIAEDLAGGIRYTPATRLRGGH